MNAQIKEPDALKPCPFCGGDASLHALDDVSSYIYCKECKTRLFMLPVEWNRRADGWISVKERLPFEQQMVMMWIDAAPDYQVEVGWWEGDSWRSQFYSGEWLVKYWQPLPEPPKETK